MAWGCHSSSSSQGLRGAAAKQGLKDILDMPGSPVSLTGRTLCLLTQPCAMLFLCLHFRCGSTTEGSEGSHRVTQGWEKDL